MIKAVILCAGFGTRLGELTKSCPKPLLKIKGQPILHHIIASLKNAGVGEICVNLHYLADQIKDYVGDGSKWGIKIQTRYETEPSGTFGGVRLFKDILDSSTHFFVIYGDIVSSMNLNILLNFHENHNGKMSIVYHRRAGSNSALQVGDDGVVQSFQERPKLANPTHESKVNSAIYLCRPDILNAFLREGYCDFPLNIFPHLVAEHSLYAIEHQGARWAIDSVDRYHDANLNFPFQNQS